MNSAFSVRAVALTVTATAFITAAIAVKMLRETAVPPGGDEKETKKGNENGAVGNDERGYGHQLPWDFGKERGEVAFKVYNEANQLMFKGHALVRCEHQRHAPPRHLAPHDRSSQAA